LLGVLCASLAGAAGTAGAQAQGIPVNPGGPAGAEYALPAEEALDETGATAPPPSVGSSGGAGSASDPEAGNRLFGVGVTPAGGRTGEGPSDASVTPGAARSGAEHGPPARATEGRSAASYPRWGEFDDAGGGSPAWLLSALAVAVVAGAGALGFALRRPRVAPPAA
jgi:hypothetical protein